MSDDKAPLGLDVYLALAAIGWADGHLDADEADAIVKTALEEGLDIDEVGEIERATKEPISLGDIDVGAMRPEDRLFVYAVAVWMTTLDDEVTDAEVAALSRLGDTLGVSEESRGEAEMVVREVAYLSQDDRPFGYDLGALRKVVEDRLTRS